MRVLPDGPAYKEIYGTVHKWLDELGPLLEPGEKENVVERISKFSHAIISLLVNGLGKSSGEVMSRSEAKGAMALPVGLKIKVDR